MLHGVGVRVPSAALVQESVSILSIRSFFCYIITGIELGFKGSTDFPGFFMCKRTSFYFFSYIAAINLNYLLLIMIEYSYFSHSISHPYSSPMYGLCVPIDLSVSIEL